MHVSFSEIVGAAVGCAAIVGPLILRTHAKVSAVLVAVEKVLEAANQPGNQGR